MEKFKVYTIYGNKQQLIKLINILAENEYCFHFSGEYIYLSYDITNWLQENYPQLNLVCNMENWTLSCFNFDVIQK